METAWLISAKNSNVRDRGKRDRGKRDMHKEMPTAREAAAVGWMDGTIRKRDGKKVKGGCTATTTG